MEIKQFIEKLERLNFFLVVEGEKLVLKGNKNELTAEELKSIKENSEVITYIKERKEDLIKYILNSTRTSKPRSESISSIYRLSPLQEGLLFHGLYDDTGGAYVEQFGCEVEGLEGEVFREAWAQVIGEHSILRSGFYHDAFNIPVQCVYREVKLPVEEVDLRGLGEEEQRVEIDRVRSVDRGRGFEFRVAPLMRVTLLRLEDERYYLLWSFHHLILDGWSMAILMESFLTVYEERLGGAGRRQKVEDNYEDYIRYIGGRDKEGERGYWAQYLRGKEGSCLLPFVQGTGDRTHGVGEYREELLMLDEGRTLELGEFSRRHRLTVNAVMQGVWSYLLHRYTGQAEVVYGVTVSGRPEDLAGVEQRVGMYTNTLPLCTEIRQEEGIVDWLEGLQRKQQESRLYQYSSLRELQDLAGVRGEWFDTMLIFQNYPVSKVVEAGSWTLKIEHMEMREQTNNYPLSLRIQEGEKTEIQFVYKEALIDPAYIREIRDQFGWVLEQLLEGRTERVGDLRLLGAEQEYRLVHSFNATAVAYDRDRTVMDLFGDQVNKNPAAVAVVYGQERLTYEELDRRSNQLARHLRELGVKEETLVPLCVERGPGMIIGILGILKAGGAYVPVDPEYPADRIAYMLEDTGSELVVSESGCRGLLPGVRVVQLDADRDRMASYPDEALPRMSGPDGLAYMIYTSGSTGRPKGVLVEHRSISNLIACQSRDFGIDATERIAQFSNYCFDASVEQIFLALCNGAVLVLVGKALLQDTGLFRQMLERQGVTHLHATPGFLETIGEESYSYALKRVIVGGDVCSVGLGRRWKDAVDFYNEYGPTETAVTAIEWRWPKGEQGQFARVPIGRPLAGVSVYLLDKDLRLVPYGAAGELCIGGVQVARGYWKRPELTAEKFVANPYGEGRLYRTGDVARWLSDGTLEYLGRRDDQVKIRGYRIELGEVESVLGGAPGIGQVAVVVNDGSGSDGRAGSGSGHKLLVGYVVPGEGYSREWMLEYLRERLPEYMVPGVWVEVEALPLTANGKVDRKTLSALPVDGAAEGGYIAPRNETEEVLAEIWEELLGVERVGMGDDFFAMGGHSLLAIRMISAIRKQLGLDVDIREIFERPRIGELAERLEGRAGQKGSGVMSGLAGRGADRPAKIPLSYSQEQLWFVDRLQGGREYHMPYVFRLKGELEAAVLEESLRGIVERHEVLRTVVVEEEGRGWQEIRPATGWKMNYVDVGTITGEGGTVEGYIEDQLSGSFDLSADAMLKVWLIRVSSAEHVLVALLHHIAFDGWSMSVLVRELSELYRSRREGRAALLPELPWQYGDYAIWQRESVPEGVMREKIGYWKEQLRGMELLRLPVDHARPAEQSIRGGRVLRRIAASQKEALLSLSRREGVTLYMLLLGALEVLLYRYTGQEDISVGSPVAGRQRQEWEGLIGFFVNTLVLRNEVKGGESFGELLGRVKRMTLDAYAHQEVPFEKVVEVLGRQRDMSRHPVFDVKFQVENTPETGLLELGGVELEAEKGGGWSAQMDLSLDVVELPAELMLSLTYCSDLYKRETAERLLDHYIQLLESIVRDPSAEVGRLSMLSVAEERQLVHGLNATAVAYDRDRTVVDLFGDQVNKDPEAVAVVYGEERLTYGELDRRSNQLARHLRELGVKAETLVPLCVERGPGMIIGILGILKAGGAYVPVDPEYPADRIAYMLEDTGAELAVSESAYQYLFTGERMVLLDVDRDRMASYPDEALPRVAGPGHLAYMIYTSGSTGRPKGVLIEHQGVVNLVNSQRVPLGLRPGIKVFQFASFSFDASCYEIFCTLLHGGQLVMASRETILDAGLFSDMLTKNNIELITIPASYQAAIKNEIAGLKTIVSAGEALDIKLAKELQQKGIKVINAYGPTETTVCATLSEDPLKDNGVVTIGKPLDNLQAHILDKDLRLVPMGAAGELCIGGVQVARGYWKRPELTAEKFVANPYGEGRLYRTGDVARWLSDGTLEYLGRRDDQVKIRGYRVELGEVESALTALPAVTASCVVVQPDVLDSHKLVGYYIPDRSELREQEKGLYGKQVEGWKTLYDTEYGETDGRVGGEAEFDITGWKDSFTGESLPAAEMAEWVEDIVGVILSGAPRRVLEIGCGTGLLYYRMAERLEKYIGTDLSSACIGRIEDHIGRRGRSYCETELRCCAAHEVWVEEEEGIDTVVLNSIVQYFPAEEYLSEVIERSLRLLGGKGRIIIGDVRDYRLLRLFKSRLLLGKVGEGADIREFRWLVDQEMSKEEELCLSPAYFYGLTERYASISHVDIGWKEMGSVNELSMYRYTVTLYVGEAGVMRRPEWEEWEGKGTAERIVDLLRGGAEELAISGVPNPRLYRERRLQAGLEERGVESVRDLSEWLSAEGVEEKEEWTAVESMIASARREGYECRRMPDEVDALRMHVVLLRKRCQGNIERPAAGYKGEGEWSNVPLFAESCQLLHKELRLQLQQRLPEYMIPSELVALQELPLTHSGKVDRKFLAGRESVQTGGRLHYQAPAGEREEELAAIWQELLGVSKIGRQENFFELGGHSLLVIRMVSAIRKELGIEVPIKDVFDHPTISGLSTELSKVKNGTARLSIKAFPGSRAGDVPLSFSQERLWFVDKLEGSLQYHMPWVLRLRGALDRWALEEAFRDLFIRHESLRTVIGEEGGKGYQQVKEVHDWQLPYMEREEIGLREEDLEEYISALLRAPFDLSADLMLRPALIGVSEQEYILVAVAHHIAFDGWSMSIVTRELAELYSSRVQKRQPELPVLPVQYGDYAIWQRQYLDEAVMSGKLEYWKKQLSGLSPVSLQTDFTRPARQSIKGAEVNGWLDGELKEGLRLLGQREGATLFMVLLAAFKVLLYRYSGQRSIQVGTPVAGRQQQEVEGLIGFFINMLVLRTEVEGGMSFTGLLRQVRQTTLDAYEHQEVPFEKVVEVMEVQRNTGRHPLFDISFQLLNTPEVASMQFEGIVPEPMSIDQSTTQFDLSLDMMELPEGLHLRLAYCSELYESSTMERILSHYQQLLSAIVKNPSESIDSLPTLSVAEERQLVHGFNATAVAYGRDRTVVDLFGDQVRRSPAAVAVVYGEERLTYGELDQRSNQLARHLRELGVKEDTLVPLCVERGPGMIIGILGILKAGGAYVPVDPEYPADRIAYMLEDTGAELVVTSAGQRGLFGAGVRLVIPDVERDRLDGDRDRMDGDRDRLSGYSDEALPRMSGPGDLAYMIYTSGSTGRPKGVMNEHGGLLNRLLWAQDYHGLTGEDAVLQKTTFCFDVSVWELLWPLLAGSRLVFAEPGGQRDPVYLKRVIEEQGITTLHFVPPMLGIFLENVEQGDCPTLRRVLCSGEALLPAQVNLFRQKLGEVGLYNLYGPTEAAIDVSYWEAPAKQQNIVRVPIGRPVWNTGLYILDKDLRLVPMGAAGELCIGGVQVARGYWKRPELTAEKFVANPYGEGRLYRTGDVARWLSDGTLEYLGRRDDQVKIRGYRVELGEVESVLGGAPGIGQAAVVMSDGISSDSIGSGHKRLVGYVVPGEGYSRERVMEYLRERLPGYMVPGVWAEVAALPLTANGKVDRKTLAGLPIGDDITKRMYMAPGTEQQRVLAEIWQELLGVERIGVNDDFFELGGHSLLATRVVSAIRKRLNIEITVKDLFLYPDIASLSDQLHRRSGAAVMPAIKYQPEKSKSPLSFSQERLWFVDKLEGSLQYHIPWVLRLRGALDRWALEEAFRDLFIRHESLRTVIGEEGGKGYQQVKEVHDWQLPYMEREEIGLREEDLEEYISALLRAPFDLSADLMLRPALIGVSEQEYILVAVAHHIAFDEWSMSIVARELAELYSSRVEKRQPELPVLPVQYGDYAIWQRQYLDEAVMSGKLEYWKKQLSGLSPVSLQTDFTRPARQSIKGAEVNGWLDGELKEGLRLLGQREGATLFMVLLAAFKVLLYRYSGQRSIQVGTPVAGRQQQEVEGLIGFFINMLVLRTEVEGRMSFTGLLRQVRQTTLDAYEHQEVPFEKVVEVMEVQRNTGRHPLFDISFQLLNTPEVASMQFEGIVPEPVSIDQVTTRFDFSLDMMELPEGLHLRLAYCSELYESSTMERLLEQYHQLLRSVVSDPAQATGGLRMQTAKEEERLLGLSRVRGSYEEGSIVEVFRRQVEETPEAIAVSDEGQALSYRQLEERSNRLGHYLREKGVREEMPVPVCMLRGVEMMVAILGILKAGGAYVPIDPGYPVDRIEYMVENTGSAIVVSESACEVQLGGAAGRLVICVDREAEEIGLHSSGRVDAALDGGSLAYVMYTSGSTGTPKGVAVEHGNVVSLVRGVSYVVAAEGEVLLSTGSVSFDATTFEYWSMWLNGGRLLLCRQEVLLEVGKLKAMIGAEGVTMMWFTAGWFNELVEADLSLFAGLRTVLVGGDKLSAAHIGRLRSRYKGVRIINGYGPTENTTFSLTYTIGEEETIGGEIPIGRPMENRMAYVLDEGRRLCAEGVPGEIYVGGAGLSRGYWKHPELTAEKFVDNPYGEGRLYRTGDQGRWNKDGVIEYLGRKDDQVKIRGYRVELGEVESVLGGAPGVGQAAVVVSDGSGGDGSDGISSDSIGIDGSGSGDSGSRHKRLVGYVVPGEGYSRERVVEYLRERLPGYMVPGVWAEVETLPLTANGKVDRKTLSALPIADDITKRMYMAPGNELEEVLAGIWEELLGVERIGIDDNFFERGGDSIITIQVVSRARRAGIVLQAWDLFMHQSIGSLSAYLRRGSGSSGLVAGEQGVLSGTFGLLPIQQWYLEGKGAVGSVSHYNQSVLLRLAKGTGEGQLSSAVSKLYERHDALRLRFERNGEGRWEQSYGAETGAQALRVEEVDLGSVPGERLPAELDRYGTMYQGSLSIGAGRLVRVVRFRTGAEEEWDRLLLVVHHLAIDGVSWRILLEELEGRLSGRWKEEEKGWSYRQWYGGLESYSRSGLLRSQVGYWEKIVRSYRPLGMGKGHPAEGESHPAGEKGHPAGEKGHSAAGEGKPGPGLWRSYSCGLGVEETRRLLQESAVAYGTEVNDLLLCGLWEALSEWSGLSSVVIGLEGHGREGGEIRGSDTSRTVGWFTTLYPVLLEGGGGDRRSRVLRIKEQLRRVPQKGLGYGVLKYMSREERLGGGDSWDVVFNYLGQTDGVVGRGRWLGVAEEGTGESMGEGIGRRGLEVNSIVSEGRLQVSWGYGEGEYGEERIREVAEGYVSVLRALIDHCCEQAEQRRGDRGGMGAVIPSDHGLSGWVSCEELDDFLEEQEGGVRRRELVEGLYRLSPLQEGLLFHGLYDETGGAYVEQFGCEVEGLEREVFGEAWAQVIGEHSILRSGFYHDVFDLPVQCVYREVKLPVEEVDLRGLGEEEQGVEIERVRSADHGRGFEFRAAPLMRVTLLRLGEDRYYLLWSFDHLILDGWSMAILMESFLTAYEDLLRGAGRQQRVQDNYEDYIRYIGGRDKEGERGYWAQYLRGKEGSCLLPFVQGTGDRTRGVGAYREELLMLDEGRTLDIGEFSRRHRLTVNTVMQGVWSYLLHRYTGQAKVVYGVTVSGRPEDLAGVEQRIGLYINMLPLCTEIREKEGIVDWLRGLQREQQESRMYQYSSLRELQGLAGVQGDWFDTMMIFQNYPVSKVVESGSWTLKIENMETQEQTNYLLSIIIGIGEQIGIRFGYNADLLEQRHVQQISRHFEHILGLLIKDGVTKMKHLDDKYSHYFTPAQRTIQKEDLFDFEPILAQPK